MMSRWACVLCLYKESARGGGGQRQELYVDVCVYVCACTCLCGWVLDGCSKGLKPTFSSRCVSVRARVRACVRACVCVCVCDCVCVCV